MKNPLSDNLASFMRMMESIDAVGQAVQRDDALLKPQCERNMDEMSTHKKVRLI